MAGFKDQQTYVGKGYVPSRKSEKKDLSARNLRKDELGGVIFGCTHHTIHECLSRQLFGLPRQHFSYVRNIGLGLPLFLFNYSDRKLHGIFEAASTGRMNIDMYGWTENGAERTSYPAQVQICVRMPCQPLIEEQFRPIIADNYYSRTHFCFELDFAQANMLMSIMATVIVTPCLSKPKDKTVWRVSGHLPSNGAKKKDKQSLTLKGKQSGQSSCVSDSTVAAPCENENLLESEVFYSCHSSSKSDSPETDSHATVVQESDKDHVLKRLKELVHKQNEEESDSANNGADSAPKSDMHLEKSDLIEKRLKELVLKQNEQESNSANNDADSAPKSDMHLERSDLIEKKKDLERENEEKISAPSLIQTDIPQLDMEIEELASKTEQTTEISSSIDKLVLDSIGSGGEELTESIDEQQLDPTESIFLLGGYNGKTWLSNLDLYCPSQNLLKSCAPMSCARSYASVAQLNDEVYVIGGAGNDATWYDTVESYNPATDRWTSCPSLKRKKGSLSGATLNNKIFAMGGGDGIECLSEVEMLDLDVGRWIPARSMLQKRFAHAAVELNGVLYATGGFSGNKYLNSAERFDPRELSWTSINNMKSKRASHALVVLDEKLYAIGGFDGDKMTSSVEIYEPRLGTWVSGDSMNHSRGYFTAAVLKEGIYVIGGVRGEEPLDSVECFKEGNGWQDIAATPIGKRCASSSFTL